MRKALSRRAEDRGFSLVEVMVALSLLTISAAAAVPLLLSAASASRTSKFITQAKGLAQQRVEQMRNLPYHVDATPAYPRVDLLDLYYPNLTAASGSTILNVASGYVTTQTRLAEEPASGPFYRTVVSSLGSDFTRFRQVVAVQYLTNARAPVTPGNTYDRQVQGNDVPPSLYVGVTVITGYLKPGSSGSTPTYKLYTQISDSAIAAAEVASQARASALRLTSQLDGGQLVNEAGIVNAEGSRANGATASFSAQGGVMFQNPGLTVTGAELVRGAPPEVATGSANVGRRSLVNGDACTITCLGVTRVDNGFVSVSGSLPRVGTESAPVTAGVVRDVYGVRFSNAPTLATLALRANEPLVFMSEVTGNDLAIGTAYLDATANGAGHLAKSVATAKTQLVQMFPTTFTPAGRGVVEVELRSSSLSCLAGTGGPTATGTFEAYVSYYSWATKSYVTLPVIKNGGTNVLSALNPATIQVGPTQFLSDYVGAWSNLTAASTTVTGSSVTSNLEGIISITTAATRTGDPTSTIGVRIGSLSCYAEDTRP
jgi:prepilin-type N-terminal cleavage/methylation domain-containing protein